MFVDVDDPNLVEIELWRHLNPSFHRRFKFALEELFKAEDKTGNDSFCFPDWTSKKITVDPNCLDPFMLDLHQFESREEESLYKIDKVCLDGEDGKVIPLYVFTAFFQFVKP
jgi:hypothetical protein